MNFVNYVLTAILLTIVCPMVHAKQRYDAEKKIFIPDYVDACAEPDLFPSWYGKWLPIEIMVTDCQGAPIANARVEGLFMAVGAGRGKPSVAYTDADGKCTIHCFVYNEVGCSVTVPGYRGRSGIFWQYMPDGQYRPLLNHYSIALQASFEKENDLCEIGRLNPALFVPILGRPLAFDFYKGSFLPPHGKGVTTDAWVTATCHIPFEQVTRNHYRYTVEFSFVNPLDGFLVTNSLPPFIKSRGWDKLSLAPEDGYTNSFVTECSSSARHHVRHVDQLVFRFRSQMTPQGIQAYYGTSETVWEAWDSDAGREDLDVIGVFTLDVPVYRFNPKYGSRILRWRNEHDWEWYSPPPESHGATVTPDSAPYLPRVAETSENSLGMEFLVQPVAGVRFGVHEVRNRDFRAFRKSHDSSAGLGLKLTGKNQPVVNVTWEDAEAFCRWLTERERGKGNLSTNEEYRLPTDAEWDAASGLGAAGIEERAWPWGWAWPPPSTAGNYMDEGSLFRANELGGIAEFDDRQLLSAPVGSFNRNVRGLYDMGGNVWEMCGTCLSNDVWSLSLRGGSWRTDGMDRLRIGWKEPYERAADDIGFRCVIAPVAEGVQSEPGPALPAAPVDFDLAEIPFAAGTNLLAGLQFAEIPAGHVAICSTRGEWGDGGGIFYPAVDLSITKNYWIGVREITQSEYVALMENPGFSESGANLPADNVSWTNAMVFCRKLTALGHSVGSLPEGYVYSLPTSAQWLLACDVDLMSEPNGGTLLAGAWAEENAGGHLHPVATRAANRFGLYDMMGNVAEWCSDWYDKTFPSDSEEDPLGPPSGSRKTIRGGNIQLPVLKCFPSVSFPGPVDQGGPGVGFRVAIVPEDQVVP